MLNNLLGVIIIPLENLVKCQNIWMTYLLKYSEFYLFLLHGLQGFFILVYVLMGDSFLMAAMKIGFISKILRFNVYKKSFFICIIIIILWIAV